MSKTLQRLHDIDCVVNGVSSKSSISDLFQKLEQISSLLVGYIDDYQNELENEFKAGFNAALSLSKKCDEGEEGEERE